MLNVFDEIQRCRNDFSYFCEKYVKINDKVKGISPFTLFDFQKRLVKFYDDNQFSIAVKFRDGGFSTTTAIFGFYKCLFNANIRFVIVSKTYKESLDFFRAITSVINLLPSFFREMISFDDNYINFKITGSSLKFVQPNMTIGESACNLMPIRDITDLFIDEAAFIPDMENYWMSFYPHLTKDGNVFVVSTANNPNGWFYEIFEKAKNYENSFKIFNCHYSEHPNFTEEKVKQLRQTLGEKAYFQEIEGCFISESTSEETLNDILANHGNIAVLQAIKDRCDRTCIKLKKNQYSAYSKTAAGKIQEAIDVFKELEGYFKS